MELLNTQYKETTFDIRLTETELGTILVALGNINYPKLIEYNHAYQNPYKVFNDVNSLDNFTNELTELIP